MPNLGVGRTTITLLPPVPAMPPLLLPAGTVFCGGIASVPFDGTAGVEGTFEPTSASSPDAVIHGTLLAELKKAKSLRKATQ